MCECSVNLLSTALKNFMMPLHTMQNPTRNHMQTSLLDATRAKHEKRSVRRPSVLVVQLYLSWKKGSTNRRKGSLCIDYNTKEIFGQL